ncbi:MAG: heavy metal sensor signal transduction histidine kinase [Thermodesulfobacterium geofontis]|uniref:Heavy metal sensor signal transduction histidine kinase n=1 Tax=Thermodesulfobacterium geofontis TaxID=1295609 RepID=A0A2N7QDP5_9BACT|nr:MAG: heavy metal sensor signal transduction histidine kinase [Thermodesulfobacterium geofontis]
MEFIKVTWQGLIDKNGKTFERFNKTYLNIESALRKLDPLISNLGIKIILEKKELTEEEFEKDPLSSNRVFINGEPIEDILNLKIGESICCGTCKGLECRTILEDKKETEEIPEKYIITALFAKIREKF